MSRPENMTPDEAEIWQRMEQHGEELVRDMGAAMMQAERLPELMQDRLLAMVRGKGKRYMVSSEKEMSFMTELMRRQGEVQP